MDCLEGSSGHSDLLPEFLNFVMPVLSSFFDRLFSLFLRSVFWEHAAALRNVETLGSLGDLVLAAPPPLFPFFGSKIRLAL